MPETAPTAPNSATANASGLAAPALGAVLADGGPHGDAVRRALAVWGRELEQASQRTAGTYGREARAYLAFISTVRGPFPAGLLTATASDVGAFVNLNAKLSASSRAVKASALRSLYGALVRDGLLAVSPAAEVKVKHAKSGRHHAAIPQSEVLDVLAGLAKKDDIRSKRDLAMIAVLLGVGLRRFELASLSVGDLKRQADGTGLLHIAGKGSKHNTMPVTRRVMEAVDRWLEASGRGTDAALPIFTNLDRRPALKGARITPHGVREVVRSYFKNHSPHGLRARVLSDVYESADGNIEMARQVARHSQISTTDGYLQVNRISRAMKYVPEYLSLAEA